MKGRKSEGRRRYNFKLENEKKHLAVGCNARKRELPGQSLWGGAGLALFRR